MNNEIKIKFSTETFSEWFDYKKHSIQYLVTNNWSELKYKYFLKVRLKENGNIYNFEYDELSYIFYFYLSNTIEAIRPRDAPIGITLTDRYLDIEIIENVELVEIKFKEIKR